MARITYFGHDAFLLEANKTKIIFDPFLSGNPLCSVKPQELKVNYILITHGHTDHLGDGVELAKSSNATIVAPYELAIYCQNQGALVHPMHIGGSFNFSFGRIKLTMASHGSAYPENGRFIYTGNPCGFLVTIDEKTIYHAGDTGIFQDMQLIGEMDKIELALLPIGGNFTMDIKDAIKAVSFLNPEITIPMHYNTFEIIKADPHLFASELKNLGYKAKVLEIGQTLEF